MLIIICYISYISMITQQLLIFSNVIHLKTYVYFVFHFMPIDPSKHGRITSENGDKFSETKKHILKLTQTPNRWKIDHKMNKNYMIHLLFFVSGATALDLQDWKQMFSCGNSRINSTPPTTSLLNESTLKTAVFQRTNSLPTTINEEKKKDLRQSRNVNKPKMSLPFN